MSPLFPVVIFMPFSIVLMTWIKLRRSHSIEIFQLNLCWMKFSKLCCYLVRKRHTVIKQRFKRRRAGIQSSSSQTIVCCHETKTEGISGFLLPVAFTSKQILNFQVCQIQNRDCLWSHLMICFPPEYPADCQHTSKRCPIAQILTQMRCPW